MHEYAPLAEPREAELLDNGAKLHVCPGPALITPLGSDDLIGSCRCSEQGQINLSIGLACRFIVDVL